MTSPKNNSASGRHFLPPLADGRVSREALEASRFFSYLFTVIFRSSCVETP
jgi:hypothetical protein